MWKGEGAWNGFWKLTFFVLFFQLTYLNFNLKNIHRNFYNLTETVMKHNHAVNKTHHFRTGICPAFYISFLSHLKNRATLFPKEPISEIIKHRFEPRKNALGSWSSSTSKCTHCSVLWCSEQPSVLLLKAVRTSASTVFTQCFNWSSVSLFTDFTFNYLFSKQL